MAGRGKPHGRGAIMPNPNAWTLSQWIARNGLTRTRYPGLGLTHNGPNRWRWVDIHDPSNVGCVGPVYRTKIEAMGDLERYARESWGYT